ncbi:hypothetical protein MSG28_000375 [Choristoneura fumiferana]|uniref:Uncharacterized protein n=1 Tax=Choristoneura fumiferana TaxID=7141 RepID=A0ACC0K0W2_CHOFU|nr:hypothetical protein MSG28_000375 [Choristoneura fumiferana]
MNISKHLLWYLTNTNLCPNSFDPVILGDDRLKVNLTKRSFFQTDIEYLGHKISKDGIRPTNSKIQEAITKATPPTNAQELRSFLGLVNFYEKFIPHLHSFCADLHALTGTRQKWRWTDKENTAFENAKNLISKSKPLVAFDEKRPLFLACDASEKGLKQ